MKKMQKIFGMLLVMLIAIGASVTTVSAAKVGDDLSVGGVGLGWILIGLVVIIVVILLAVQVTKKAAKPFVPILAILLIAGLVLQCVDVAVEPGEITPSVTWDVTAASDTADMTINNDARTITKLIWADVDLEVINATDDSVWVGTVDDIWINFTITPSLAVGVSSTTNQATTTCSVLTPDQSFTEDGTSYDLFADVAAGGDKDLLWTTDTTTAYESKLCTVTIGGAEVAELRVTLLDDGLSQYEAGETQSFQISLGGITYTVTIIVTALT